MSTTLTFNIYADGSEGTEDNLAELIENAKDLQSISEFSEEWSEFEEHYDTDVEILRQLFMEFRKSEVLMFPYEPKLENAIDYGYVQLNDDDRYRIDRYKLTLENPENSYPRDAIRFDLNTTPELPNLTQLLSKPAGVGKYFKSGHARTDEIILLGVTKDQVSALCEVDVDSEVLMKLFVDALLSIAQSPHGTMSKDLVQMICVEWITSASGEDTNIFDQLTEMLLDPSYYEESLDTHGDGGEWEMLGHDVLNEIKNNYMPFSDLAASISEDLENSGLELTDDDEDLQSIVEDLLGSLLFDHGYWTDVLAEKLEAFAKAMNGLPTREINDLSTIVYQSRNEGAYVLEVEMSRGNSLDFLLNPTTLLLQNRISVEDSYFYDEA